MIFHPKVPSQEKHDISVLAAIADLTRILLYFIIFLCVYNFSHLSVIGHNIKIIISACMTKKHCETVQFKLNKHVEFLLRINKSYD